jgi:hypothetical protein
VVAGRRALVARRWSRGIGRGAQGTGGRGTGLAFIGVYEMQLGVLSWKPVLVMEPKKDMCQTLKKCSGFLIIQLHRSSASSTNNMIPA